ncbi:MAG TPA: hypothetical protein VHE35_33050 [Kofleriaceae bacterium]|nr:hypothetical protein [Kofleriaceae bacterium]
MLARLAPSLFVRALVLALPLAAACGDNLSPEGSVDAAPSIDATPVDAPPAHATAAAVAGDFAVTGVFSTVDVVTRQATPNALAGVAGGDPYLRRYGDELFIVNRAQGENVTILGGRPLALVDQFATGGGSNPQDVAVAGHELYLPAMGTAGIVIIDRQTRAKTTLAFPTIDPDGKPDCVSAYAVGAKVYVACGILDATFTPRGNGKVVVVDSTTDTVETTFDLPFPNPIGLITPATAGALGGDLLVATAPSFTSAADGCIARIHTGATPSSGGCLLRNADLGAYANRFEMSADGAKVWIAAALYAADFSSQSGRLRSFDVGRNALDVGASPAEQLVLDVATCPDGRVVVGDAKMGASGLRVYLNAAEESTGPIGIGRPIGGGNGLVCY